jgi:hypothetical protein
VPQLQGSDRKIAGVGGEAGDPHVVGVGDPQRGPGWGRSLRTISRMPAAQSRRTSSASPATHASSRILPSASSGCRPARGQTDTRIGTDTLLHLRSAAFSTTVRTLDEPYRPRSAALLSSPLLSSWVTSRATSLVKARGQLPACLPPDARPR